MWGLLHQLPGAGPDMVLKCDDMNAAHPLLEPSMRSVHSMRSMASHQILPRSGCQRRVCFRLRRALRTLRYGDVWLAGQRGSAHLDVFLLQRQANTFAQRLPQMLQKLYGHAPKQWEEVCATLFVAQDVNSTHVLPRHATG